MHICSLSSCCLTNKTKQNPAFNFNCNMVKDKDEAINENEKNNNKEVQADDIIKSERDSHKHQSIKM